MAVYDVNAAIQKPNFANSLQQGIAFGQQQRAIAEQRADQNALRTLAPEIMAGNPDAYRQAAVIDPQAANQYQGAGDAQLKRLGGFVKFVEQARSTGNTEAVNAALRQGAPYISQILGKPAPTEWTDDMAPGWEAMKAQIAMVSQPEAQRNLAVSPGSAIVDPDTGQVVYERPFAPAKPQNAVFKVDAEGVGWWVSPDAPPQRVDGGMPAPVTGGGAQVLQDAASPVGDPKADYQQLAQAFGARITSLDRTPERNAAVGGVPNSQHVRGTAGDFVVPDQSKPAFIQAARERGYEAIDEGDHIHLELPPGRRTTSAVVDGPRFQTPGAASQRPSALEERLTAAREMGATPEQLQAIVMGSASTKGPSAAEQKDALARKAKQPQLQNAVRGLSRIESALSQLEGGLVNTGPVDAMVQRYTPAGQELEAAVGGIQNSFLSLTRVPGIGSQSDLEARIANLQYPSLDKPPEVNRRTMENLRAFARDLQDAYQVATATDSEVTAPAPSGGAVQRARNPQTGQVLVLRDGQWVPE